MRRQVKCFIESILVHSGGSFDIAETRRGEADDGPAAYALV
jgi:hypothetical protein